MLKETQFERAFEYLSPLQTHKIQDNSTSQTTAVILFIICAFIGLCGVIYGFDKFLILLGVRQLEEERPQAEEEVERLTQRIEQLEQQLLELAHEYGRAKRGLFSKVSFFK